MADDTNADMIRVREGQTVRVIPRDEFNDDIHEHAPLNKPAPTRAVEVNAKNPSGTFSEPTPTDIRYPNKDLTEFENNHGAFFRKSAAQMRQDADLPDAPGGIYPDGHIPDDWETLDEVKRVDLANKISQRTDVTPAQANDVIRAEAEKRKNDPESEKKRMSGLASASSTSASARTTAPPASVSGTVSVPTPSPTPASSKAPAAKK